MFLHWHQQVRWSQGFQGGCLKNFLVKDIKTGGKFEPLPPCSYRVDLLLDTHRRTGPPPPPTSRGWRTSKRSSTSKFYWSKYMYWKVDFLALKVSYQRRIDRCFVEYVYCLDLPSGSPSPTKKTPRKDWEVLTLLDQCNIFPRSLALF